MLQPGARVVNTNNSYPYSSTIHRIIPRHYLQPASSTFCRDKNIVSKPSLFLKPCHTPKFIIRHGQNPLFANEMTDDTSSQPNSKQPRHQHQQQQQPQQHQETTESLTNQSSNTGVELDVPLPTVNGGYSHTAASRAKISAANKGKTPWNKGKTRSEQVKQRIAEGVRRKNRERFLAKLQDMGLTEEEFELQKKEERRKKDAERRARLTEKGGYRPTEETKQKISKILKEKHAKGEIQRKRTYNGPFRKGFTHSEETKEKIRISLKKKWAEDPEYQAKMKKTGQKTNTLSARQKISQTLKQKWQDPEFRLKMINSMKGRKTSSSVESNRAQREKISAAMKKKWQDRNYRQKAIMGMERYRDSLPPRPTKTKPTVRKNGSSGINEGKIVPVTPMKESKQMKPLTSIQSKMKVASVVDGGLTKTIKKTKSVKKKKIIKTAAVQSETVKDVIGPPKNVKDTSFHDSVNHGDISKMKEERRDLYDLLYGDDYDDINHDDGNINFGKINGESSDGGFELDYLEEDGNHISTSGPVTTSMSPFFTTNVHLDDEDLDDFDPYNLDDY